MMVHPDHQRKGIGQKLLQWGVDYADKEKIAGWLFARPAGSKMYRNNGWKAVATLPFDVPGMEIEPSLAMLRTPQTRA
jgi:GNAT superfamily N-acetyltransferase